MEDRIFTIDEVAKYLKIPKPTLYYLAQQKDIPAFKVGRHWRFEKYRIDKWIEKQYLKKGKTDGSRKSPHSRRR